MARLFIPSPTGGGGGYNVQPSRHFFYNSKVQDISSLFFLTFDRIELGVFCPKKSRSQALPRSFYGLFVKSNLRPTFFIPHRKIHTSAKLQVSKWKDAFIIAKTKFRQNFGQNKSWKTFLRLEAIVCSRFWKFLFGVGGVVKIDEQHTKKSAL